MKINISTKVYFIIVIFVILPLLFLGWFFISHESREIKKELGERARTIVNNLASNCEYGLLVGNKQELTLLLAQTILEKDIIYASIEGINGTEITNAGSISKKYLKFFSATVFTHSTSRDNSDLAFYDSKKQSEKIGIVKIGVSLLDMKIKLAQLQRMVFFITILVIIISFICALISIRYLINKPFKKLLSSIKTIGQGNLSHRVPISSQDEIGTLAESFNLMTESLSKSLVSKDFMDNIIQSLNDLLIVFEPQGIIKVVNSASLYILGYKENELIGKNIRMIFCKEDFFFDISSFLETFTENRNEERKLLRKDGSTLVVSCSISVMLDNKKKIEGYIFIAQDISERKKIEAEKLRLEKKLLIAEKMEALGRLAGGVAHDLNNILGAIVGYPDILLKQLPKDSKLLKPVHAIQNSGQKAAAVVQDLLTLVRQGIHQKESIKFNHLIKEYLKSPECKAIKKLHPRIQIIFKPEPQLKMILGSHLHLLKTIMNLVANSAEAISGKGRILIKTDNCYIDRQQQEFGLDLRIGEYIKVRITDNGIGIKEKDLKKIFEPFFTKKKMGRSGTGLGMAVVWGTLKDHHGYVSIKSEMNKGTSFDIYFPVIDDSDIILQKSESIKDISGNGEEILMIDDMEEQREIAYELLTELGYSVNTVSDITEALDFLKMKRVDLILLDMIMPGKYDGLDTYREIVKLYPGIKAIIVSGYSETKRVKEAQLLGVGAYLRKPYTINEIGLAIKKELERV